MKLSNGLPTGLLPLIGLSGGKGVCGLSNKALAGFPRSELLAGKGVSAGGVWVLSQAVC